MQKIFTSVFLVSFLFGFRVQAELKKVGGDGSDGGNIRLPNPLDPNNQFPNMTFSDLIAQIIRGGLGIVGSITLLVFIYGGFLWLTSAGDGKKVEQGKNILLWSTIGLAIIFSSYALVKFVITSIGG